MNCSACFKFSVLWCDRCLVSTTGKSSRIFSRIWEGESSSSQYTVFVIECLCEWSIFIFDVICFWRGFHFVQNGLGCDDSGCEWATFNWSTARDKWRRYSWRSFYVRWFWIDRRKHFLSATITIECNLKLTIQIRILLSLFTRFFVDWLYILTFHIKILIIKWSISLVG
jgi:hypothetical protein